MLQKLIDEIEKKIAVEDYAIADNAYRECITLITKAFPDFEAAIKKAYEDGYSDGVPNAIKQDNGFDGDAQDYYNKNYKNESRT